MRQKRVTRHGEPFERKGRPRTGPQQVFQALKVARHVAVDECDPDEKRRWKTRCSPSRACRQTQKRRAGERAVGVHRRVGSRAVERRHLQRERAVLLGEDLPILRRAVGQPRLPGGVAEKATSRGTRCHEERSSRRSRSSESSARRRSSWLGGRPCRRWCGNLVKNRSANGTAASVPVLPRRRHDRRHRAGRMAAQGPLWRADRSHDPSLASRRARHDRNSMAGEPLKLVW